MLRIHFLLGEGGQGEKPVLMIPYKANYALPLLHIQLPFVIIHGHPAESLQP